jgi:hypothetical protein
VGGKKGGLLVAEAGGLREGVPAGIGRRRSNHPVTFERRDEPQAR